MPERMKLLFVCTGNTCRSPLAAAIARKLATERGQRDVQIDSAGTSPWEGAPASDGALLVGLERQLDLSAHRARQLTREMVQSSDVILGMGPHHLERIEALGGAGKSYMLTEYASHGASARAISDPIGAELEVYRATYEELEREINRVFDRLAAEQTPGPS
jgi:protein-tyrosine-phosphatase